MTIRIRLTGRGSLQQAIAELGGTVEMPTGILVNEILSVANLPEMRCLYIVNGSVAPRGTVVKDGDRVEIHPQMAGG